MKKLFKVRRAAITLLSTCSIFIIAQSASAASWSFSDWSVAHNNSNAIYSSSFTKASNADSTISISGWQDTGVSTPVDLDYSIVKKGLLNDTRYGAVYPVTANKPKSGTWFSNVFSSIPTQTTLYLKVYSSYHTVPVSGGGNTYD